MNMKKIGLGSIAAAGAAALVMGLGTPAMAAPPYTAPVISGPSAVTLPSSTVSKVNVSATFQGAAPTANLKYYWYDAAYAGPSLTLLARNSKIRSSYVSAAKYAYTNDYSSTAVPGVATGINFSVNPYTTPGKYRLNLPVTQKGYNPSSTQTLFGYKEITVKANTSFSKKRTYATGSPKYGRAFKVKVNAPYYQVGAKVTAYVKLPGKKKYKKVTSGYLKSSNSSTSKASLKISSKYNKNKARFYFKVSAAPYAGSYKTTTYKITVRRY